MPRLRLFDRNGKTISAAITVSLPVLRTSSRYSIFTHGLHSSYGFLHQATHGRVTSAPARWLVTVCLQLLARGVCSDWQRVHPLPNSVGAQQLWCRKLSMGSPTFRFKNQERDTFATTKLGYCLKRLQFERDAIRASYPSAWPSLRPEYGRQICLFPIRHQFTELHKLPPSFQEPPLLAVPKRGCTGQNNAI